MKQYPSNIGWIGKLIYILYFFSKYGMNSMIQELWNEMNSGIIKNKEDFIEYCKNHEFYKNIKYC